MKRTYLLSPLVFLRRNISPIFTVFLLLGIIAGGNQHIYAQERTPDYSLNPVVSSKNGASATQQILAATEAEVISALGLVAEDVASISFNGSDPNSYGVFTSGVAGFPRDGDDYLVLSSGFASVAFDANTSGSTSGTMNGLNSPGGGEDMVQLTLTLNVPPGASSVSFEFKFFSEEFPEFVGSSFNDGFITEVGTSTFTVSGVNIIAPDNVVFDQNGEPVTINTTGVLGMSTTNAAGTTYDGATPVLTTTVPIPVGAETIDIIFSVFDVGDSIYDSAVFLDKFEFDSKNLELVGLEVNQSIQNWNNSIPLIKNKTTLVRAHIQSLDTEEATAKNVRLIGRRNGTVLGEIAAENSETFMAPAQTTNDAVITTRRQDKDMSLNFPLPGNWLEGTVELELVREGGGELDCSNAAIGADCKVEVTYEEAARPKVKFIKFAYVNSEGLQVPSSAQLDELANRTNAAFPIDALTYGKGFWLSPIPGTPGQADLSLINTQLALKKYIDCLTSLGALCDYIYYGNFVNAGTTGGLANGIPGTVASGNMDFSPGGVNVRQVHSHEIGHVLGRPHAANTSTTPPGSPYKVGACGAKASLGSPDFPLIFNINGLDRAALGSMNSGQNEIVYGFDTQQNVVLSPFSTFDLMSYCFSSLWPSTYTYSNLKDEINGRFGSSSSKAQLLASTGAMPVITSAAEIDYSLFVGIIDLADDTVELLPFETIASSIVPPSVGVGEYSLQLFDENDNLIQDIPFAPVEMHAIGADDPDKGYFIIPAEVNPAVKKAEVILNNASLVSITASPNAPTVQVLSPNGGENLNGIETTISWEANDLDGDVLSYRVDFSRDGGSTWETLVTGWPNTSYTVPLNTLGETTQGLIRVMASDGFNATTDVSDGTFTTPNTAPDPSIISPLDGSTFIGLESVMLEGNGNDLEDGNLPGENLAWSSSLDGSLGTGNQILLQASGLTPGMHVITLTVTDSKGATGFSEVNIEILENIPPVTEPANCPVDMLISNYQTEPSSNQFVDITNIGNETIIINKCAVTALNVFTEATIGDATVALSGLLAPGETFRVGSAETPSINAVIADGALPSGPGAVALLDADPPADNTPIAAILPNNISGLVYLNSTFVFGVSHLRVPAYDEIYNCIYGGGYPFAPVAGCLGASKQGFATIASSSDILEMMREARLIHQDEISEVPAEFTLQQNYPNPFNPQTVIRFGIPKALDAKLVVYDVLGRQVSVLLEGTVSEGWHEVIFDASGLPSGLYIYRLETTDGHFEQKMILTK